MKLIYFHGFGSSAASGTVKTLRQELPGFEVVAPDIPVDPAEALPFLKDLCKKENPNVVIGTSMGGMYAQQMSGFNRICVNPAFFMSSESKVLKVGKFEYYKPRLDGKKEFFITEEIIRHFSEMESHQFDTICPEEQEKVWGMFGDSDTQVNCEEEFLRHYHNIVHFKGGHRLDNATIKEVLIPLIHLLA